MKPWSGLQVKTLFNDYGPNNNPRKSNPNVASPASAIGEINFSCLEHLFDLYQSYIRTFSTYNHAGQESSCYNAWGVSLSPGKALSRQESIPPRWPWAQGRRYELVNYLLTKSTGPRPEQLNWSRCDLNKTNHEKYNFFLSHVQYHFYGIVYWMREVGRSKSNPVFGYCKPDTASGATRWMFRLPFGLLLLWDGVRVWIIGYNSIMWTLWRRLFVRHLFSRFTLFFDFRTRQGYCIYFFSSSRSFLCWARSFF